MALTITDDHAAQEAVVLWCALDWQRSPSSCSERLTEGRIDATHALVRFVGLTLIGRQAASAATCSQKVMPEPYLTDTAVLETLVRDKLATPAEDVRAEGWHGWRLCCIWSA